MVKKSNKKNNRKSNRKSNRKGSKTNSRRKYKKSKRKHNHKKKRLVGGNKKNISNTVSLKSAVKLLRTYYEHNLHNK